MLVSSAQSVPKEGYPSSGAAQIKTHSAPKAVILSFSRGLGSYNSLRRRWNCHGFIVFLDLKMSSARHGDRSGQVCSSPNPWYSRRPTSLPCPSMFGQLRPSTLPSNCYELRWPMALGTIAICWRKVLKLGLVGRRCTERVGECMWQPLKGCGRWPHSRR